MGPAPEMAASSDSPKAAEAAASPPSPPRDYNPRWKGYSCILLSSLINFSAVSNIQEDRAALSFGILLFLYALAVLATDRCCGGIDWYSKAADGNLRDTRW